jgi:hypothetical protein
MTITIGSWVRLTTLPPWTERMPEESQRVIRHCVGRVFRVDEITPEGLLVLDVSAEVDPVFGGTGNDLRVETDLVTIEREPSSR